MLKDSKQKEDQEIFAVAQARKDAGLHSESIDGDSEMDCLECILQSNKKEVGIEKKGEIRIGVCFAKKDLILDELSL